MRANSCAKYGVAVCVVVATFSAQAQPLVVHEWGTFTSLQDEAGRTLGGINTDDEPVPRFCHDLDSWLIVSPGDLPPVAYKGVAACMPEVTMRLETPVLYFHLPEGAPTPVTASVKVAFRGGWLSQFYPAAVVDGFSRKAGLSESTVGTLAWNDLKIGVEAKGPQTQEKVWTAPREVAATSVMATNGESETFLFYRGVAHLPCPLQMKRTANSTMLECVSQPTDSLSHCLPLPIKHLWLASFRANGSCAFRTLPTVMLGATAVGQSPASLFTTPAEFSAADYSTSNLDQLRGEMRRALQEDGLYRDEADALLNTWEVSYFKSPGLRLFFMMPKVWTDNYLPLEISVPCTIQRAMVGRLELVTPEQRALLRTLAAAPKPTKPWAQYEVIGNRPVMQGSMPAAYRDLGRFRNTLLLDEYAVRPNPSLEAFIRVNRLQARGS